MCHIISFSADYNELITILAALIAITMLIGRKNEVGRLQELTQKDESQFCVVYGRRRVGKTYLVRESFHYEFTFRHTGVYQGDLRRQLLAFRSSLISSGLDDCPRLKNWFEAFEQLKRLTDMSHDTKKILFIDELPWMDTPKSNLVSELENFWNGWVTARPQKDVVLIVCGSATSWITRKLLKNKGGLRGRLTERIMLQPFDLSECEEYANAAGLAMSRKDIVEMYMAIGGIPYYWNFLQRGFSVAQNIDHLFFGKDAQLNDEFDALYHTIFKNPTGYVKVIEALGGKRMGLTRDKILSASGINDGGTFTTILTELEQCGFIRRYFPFGSKENGALYQLIDNYTLFHFHCIRKNAYADESYWQHTYLTPEHAAWAGLAFEQVCLQHIPQIKSALGISGVISNVCSWHTSRTENHPGAQIDLLIERGDNVINVCEMKYYNAPYTISDSEALQLRERMSTFQQTTGTRKALHLTMITCFGVARNGNWNMVQSQVLLDDLFRRQ